MFTFEIDSEIALVGCTLELRLRTLKTDGRRVELVLVKKKEILYILGGIVSPRKVSSRRRAPHGIFTSPQKTQIEFPNLY